MFSPSILIPAGGKRYKEPVSISSLPTNKCDHKQEFSNGLRSDHRILQYMLDIRKVAYGYIITSDKINVKPSDTTGHSWINNSLFRRFKYSVTILKE